MTRADIRRRLEAIEARDGEGAARTLVLMMRGQHADGQPLGIDAVPPYLQAADRAPGETWPEFLARIGDMLPARASIIIIPAKCADPGHP